MGLETVTYISDLNPLWPLGSDPKSNGDNHVRNLKTGILNSFPGVTGAVIATHFEINYLSGVTANVQVQLNAKAPLASPTFTGTVALPASTSIGTVTAAEILRLAGVLSPIQTQLDSKGAIAGQAWTGTHNFAGAAAVTVPTLPPGSTGNGAASVDYANALSFASALPGQSPATTGMFPRSDGAAAAWAYPILFKNLIGTTSTALKGFNNIITAGGITVTIPTLADGEVCDITNGSNTLTPVVDWNGAKFRGQTSPGLMTLNNLSAYIRVIGTGNATVGYV